MISRFERYLYSPSLNVFGSIVLASTWILFAQIHVNAYYVTGAAVFLIFVLSETLQAGFFLFRSQPKNVSLDPYVWLIAIGGTFATLYFRPGGVVLWQGGQMLLILGFCLQILGLLSLNRSFALVAARREIKTHFAYRIVRHPMYASYSISNIGYLLFNFTFPNLLCLTFVLVFFVLRIIEEEKLLVKDEKYVAYMKEVRYRLIPFLY